LAGMNIGEIVFNTVVEQMIEKYRERRADRRRELAKKYGADDVVFVHELVQCPLKREFAAKYPEIDAASMYNPRFVVGQLIEDAVKLHLSSKMDLEEGYFDMVLEVGGKKIVVAGSSDIYIAGDSVVEVKYLTGMYSAPHDHHIKQLSIYLLLGGLDSGQLLQVSPEGIKSVEVGPATEEELEKMVENLLNKTVAPLYEWECKLCPYEFLCSRSVARERR